jgi:nitrogen fixation/metabolism regulation signal transduction histidine kinase
MFIEMVIVGLALLYVFSQPKPDIPGGNIYFIYKAVLGIILFLTLCNITVGVYLSHKIAGPLFRFVMCIRELANGNLKIQVNLRKGDELRELEAAFNDMTERLRSNVRQDRQHLKDIQEAVQVIETMITKNTLGKAEKDKILEEVKFVQETSEKVVNYFQI